MPKVFNRSVQIKGQKKKVNASITVQAVQYDGNGDIVRCTGTTVPTNGLAGFAKGCIFIKTDASANIISYMNEGSATSALFAATPSGHTVTLTPTASDSAGVNMIPAGVTRVEVGANVTDVNDWITLPSLASVPVGFTVTVVSNAAGHEVRTPASSNEKINNQDSDGTKEYAIAAGSQIHIFRKISDSIGWMGQGFTALGAVVTAVIPD